MLKLYQREDCPFCQKVRSRLTALNLSYIAVNVPLASAARTELLELSGQSRVPVLVTEEGRVIPDSEAIVAFLDTQYGPAADEHLPKDGAAKTLADRPHYGMTRQLHGTAFHAAREKVQQLLAKEGFGLLWVVDVGSVLRSKLNVELGREYVILGTCNPRLSYEGLESEPFLGLMLPCNVVVTAADNGDAIVSAVRPSAALEAVGNPVVRGVADRAEAVLLKVISSL